MSQRTVGWLANGVVTTTNNTLTVLASFAVASGSAAGIEVHVTGRNTVTGAAVTTRQLAAVSNVSGSAAVDGALTAVVAMIGSAGLLGATVSLVANGANFDLKVQPGVALAATSVEWFASVHVHNN